MPNVRITQGRGWTQKLEIDGVDISPHTIRAHLDLSANDLATLEIEFLAADSYTEVEGRVIYSASAWGEFATGDSPVTVLRRLADAIEASHGE